MVPAIQQPVFKPAVRDIAAITPIDHETTLVTTTFDHSYHVGLIARFYIPPSYGMVQANQIKFKVLAVTPDTITIDLNTQDFDPFVIPNPQIQAAVVVPVGEEDETLKSSRRNVLPYI